MLYILLIVVTVSSSASVSDCTSTPCIHSRNCIVSGSMSSSEYCMSRKKYLNSALSKPAALTGIIMLLTR